MNDLVTSSLVVAASLVALGCPSPDQCLGDCETGSTSEPADTASTASTAASGTSTSAGSESTAADDDSGSSTGPLVPCGGSPLALCLPATGDEDALCLCPDQTLSPSTNTAVTDLDGDGAPDLLAWESGETALQPYLAAAGGLVAQDLEESPLPLYISALYSDAGGTTWLLSPLGAPAAEILRYAPREGLSSEPLPASLIDPRAESSAQALADFDGDGQVDLIEVWGPARGERTIGVSFDVLAPVPPAPWSSTVDTLGYLSLIPCALDDDGADDVLLKSLYGHSVPLWGIPMQASMTLGEQIGTPEGGATCRDLDGDGDADVFASLGCYDCSASFGGYAVLEQTTPGQFESVDLGEAFDRERYGGRTVLAHLTDAQSLDALSIGRQEVIFAPLETNLALRRPTAPLEWDDGRFTIVEGFGATLYDVIDVDLDGIDELVLRVVENEGEFGTLYLYRVEG